MAVHHPFIPEEVVAPQPGEQHLPGEDPPRRGQKGAQQLEFPGRQIQGTAVQCSLPGVQVHHQIPVMQAAFRRFAAPAKDHPDFLQQDRHGEGLGHVVVDIQAEAPELLRLSVQSREHQNGHLGLASDLRADPETVDFRQHDVQQDQVKRLGAEQVQGRRAVSGHSGRIARVLQIGAQQLLQLRLILHDQNSFHQQSPGKSIAQDCEFIMENFISPCVGNRPPFPAAAACCVTGPIDQWAPEL